MPRPTTLPQSSLRNRNRVTNKTRLKVYHGNVNADILIPDEDEEKARLLQSVAGVDQEDANVSLSSSANQRLPPHPRVAVLLTHTFPRTY